MRRSLSHRLPARGLLTLWLLTGRLLARGSPAPRLLTRRSSARGSPAAGRVPRGRAGPVAAGALAAAALLGGCGGGGAAAPPVVDDGWAAPIDDQAAAVYMTITAPEGDELTAARVTRQVAARTAVVDPAEDGEDGPGHLGHLDPGGSLGGTERHTVPLPADRPVTLEPGGFYLAIGPLNEPLAPGDTFPVTLSFREADAVTVDVTVQPDPP
jgi:copper(I)-binding protein